MQYFKKKKNKELEKSDDMKDEQKVNEQKHLIKYDKPRIALLDVAESVFNKLQESGFNLFMGSLGAQVSLKMLGKRQEALCLVDYTFPPNIQEYSIFIVEPYSDLVVDYDPESHQRQNVKTNVEHYYYCVHPQNIFDPRPRSAQILGSRIPDKAIILTFAEQSENVDYEIAEVSHGGYKRIVGKETISSHSFLPAERDEHHKIGSEINLASNLPDDIVGCMKKYQKYFFFGSTFFHPKVLVNNRYEPSKNFIPFAFNIAGEIISYVEFINNKVIYMLPQIMNDEAKSEFLIIWLEQILPRIHSDFFPFSTQFSWIKFDSYRLPGHNKLLEEKGKLIEEFEESLNQINDKINQNSSAHEYLHELLTGTGESLVKSLITYFKWLGLTSAMSMDEQAGDTLEEDIQIKLDNGGLLILEVKGIGGTSTDADCSQIAKIRRRREKGRAGKHDVHALYVVNHQRYKAPLDRKNPPFTDNQIKDAFDDERGLLTTWQLFKLYFDIENGVITKNEAIESFVMSGLVVFAPQNIKLLSKVKKTYKDGRVGIINIEDTKLSLNSEVFVNEKNGWSRLKLESIKLDDRLVEEVTTGEIGIGVDRKIKNGDEIWIRKIL